jgi:Animal haem peroxidase
VRVVGYTSAGIPIYGYTDPGSGQIVQLGTIGSFDLLNTSWFSTLPTTLGDGPAGGNVAPNAGLPLGLRNVQGLFNNITAPSRQHWGAAGYNFDRSTSVLGTDGRTIYQCYLQQRTSNGLWSLGAADRTKTTKTYNTQGGVTYSVDTAAQAAVDALASTAWQALTTDQKALVQDSNWHVSISASGEVNLASRYANPYLTVYDYTPRLISERVDSSFVNPGDSATTPLNQLSALLRDNMLAGSAAPAEAGGVINDVQIYQITDLNTGSFKVGGYDADGTANSNGVYFKESIVRNLPHGIVGDPSITGWQVLFGQFFDHGLDFIDKGGNTINGVSSKIYIPLSPDDPLYSPNQGKLGISRATVTNTAAAGADGEFGTHDDIVSPGVDGIYGTADDQAAFQDPTTGTWVTASPNYQNHTSPYIDQSQTYGSVDDTTNLLREWVQDPTTGQWTPGMRLFDGHTLTTPWTRTNPDGTVTQTTQTLPTIGELRAYLMQTGRDDLSWPM